MASKSLPIEVVQAIALMLEDEDICKLRLVCKSIDYAVSDPSFWRMRFRQVYDTPTEHAGDLVELYKQRRDLLNPTKVKFERQYGKRNGNVVKVLKELILEARPEFGPDGLPTCRNFDALIKFADESDLVRTMLMPKFVKKPHRGLVSGIYAPPAREDLTRNAILLMLTPITMDIARMRAGRDWVYNFPRSQAAAYASDALAPMFSADGLQVNVEWCLHAVNFFRHHLRAGDGVLRPHFDAMPPTAVPQMWAAPLSATYPELGRLWNGTYAYLDRRDVLALRARRGALCAHPADPLIDHHVDEMDPIQVCKFWVPEGGAPRTWLDRWEAILKSRSMYGSGDAVDHAAAAAAASPSPARVAPQTTTRPRAGGPPQQSPRAAAAAKADAKWILDGTVGFEGIGFDDEEFYASGFLNPLPAQRGVPGWQRMTMMKYFRDDDGRMDHGALWAYEGVVLPGGQIMVGRWWAPENVAEKDKYSGPIIMWCADQSVAEEYRNWTKDHTGLEQLSRNAPLVDEVDSVDSASTGSCSSVDTPCENSGSD